MANIANLLIEHINIWTAADTEKKSGRGRATGNAGSVYGVKKLRELILELAVRGKLVPQDPNDEPASELLKRIKAVTNKPLSIINENSYELPKGWEWVNFGEIAQHNSGKTLDKGRNSGILRDYITTSNLYWGKFELDSIKKMPIEESELERCSVRKHDLLICEGGEAGRAAVWTFDKEVCFQNHVHRARMYVGISPFYAYRYFEKLNATGEIEQYRKGVGISNMSGKALASVIFALPPLAEQFRICAKVDELMALCDQLEQKHSNAQDAHEALVRQLLTTLTQSLNAVEFNANWQRIYAHFDVLFNTDSSIDTLKQTILQLAVIGKLTNQTNADLSEELNNELIKNRSLMKLGKGEQANLDLPIKDIECPIDFPNNWVKIRLGKIVEIVGGSQPPKTVFIETPKIGYTRLIQIRDFKSDSYPTYIPSKYANRMFEKDDIMIGRYGPPVFQILRGLSGTYNVALMKADPINEIVSKDFLYYLLSEPRIQNLVIKESERTAGQTGIRKDLLYMFVVGLPPKEEQNRIVSKVDALMALCDQLKTRFQQANKQQQTFADALVAQAHKSDTTELIDLAAYRSAVTCNIIKRMQHNQAFGRTFAMKLLYLSQQHIGFETHLEFEREAAGPFDKWIYDFERDGVAAGWFGLIEKKLSSGYTKIEYQLMSAIDEPLALMNVVGSNEQRKELERLFALFADKKTEEAEIAATLFAAWNDFLLNGVSPTDEQIIQDVRENWHSSKARFSPDQLTKWLSWLRDNNIVPTCKGSKTIYQKTLLH
jgi:type I restriction enzyme, S subunit